MYLKRELEVRLTQVILMKKKQLHTYISTISGLTSMLERDAETLRFSAERRRWLQFALVSDSGLVQLSPPPVPFADILCPPLRP